MNQVQFKAYCKIVGYSIIALILMMACMSCSTNKESVERNQTLERERLVIEHLIKTSSKELTRLENRRHQLTTDVATANLFLKTGIIPKYKITLRVEHCRKYHHNAIIEFYVTKEEYIRYNKNKKITPTKDESDAFNITVIDSELIE